MSLDALHDEITGLRAKADKLCDGYGYAEREIMNDPNLSDVGKAEQLAPHYQQMREGVDGLRQQEKALVTQKRESLERSLFGISAVTAGNPSQVVSYRDARERAARLTDADEARDMYVAALRSDDKVMVAALLERSVELGWLDIRNDHCNRVPSARRELNDLAEVHKYEGNDLMNHLHYMTPQPAISLSNPLDNFTTEDVSNVFAPTPTIGFVE